MKRTGNSKLAVVGWGRGMGHSGHMYLADAVITQAKDMKADPYFFVSKTVGKDDPLLPEEKLAIYQTVFPQQKNIFTAEGNLNQALQELAKLGYQGVVLVVGADQKESFKYLEKPNKEGVPVYQSFGFSKLKVISRQETRSKFRGEEGPRATPMRQALLDPNVSDEEKYQVWRRDMPSALSDEQVADLMKKAQSRLLGTNKKPQVAESRIMDRNALINAYYVSTKGDRHRVAERIPYYLLDKLVGLLTKKYNITMNDIEVRPADKNQYRRTSQPELAEGMQCTPNEVAELLYNAKPEIFTKFGDEFVMNAIEQACEQHQGSAQEVAGKAVEILKQGITEGIFDRFKKKPPEPEVADPGNYPRIGSDIAQWMAATIEYHKAKHPDSVWKLFCPSYPDYLPARVRVGTSEKTIRAHLEDYVQLRDANPEAKKLARQKFEPNHIYPNGPREDYQNKGVEEAYDHNAPFNAADFNRHMEQLRAREELRKTDPMKALVGDMIDKDNAALNVKKKPQDDSSLDINDPRHPGWGALHNPLGEDDRDGMKDGRPYSDPLRRHPGNESYMTPDYLIQKYTERLAQIAAGPYKRPKEVAQLKSRIAKLQGQQGVDEGSEEALQYATQAHAGQTRSGGDPYITHPMRVADHIRQYKQSHNLDALISAAYLHDTIEDTDTTQEVLHDLFGGLVASLVKELTSDPEQIKKMGKAAYLSHKMAVMSSYGLVIKLADRLDNVKDITTAKTPEWRQKYAKETNQILDYIEKTRALSGTHKKLIELIRAKLAEIDNPPQVADEGISRRGILKGIAGAGALGAAGKASAIAGAFPTPSAQQAMYKAAADSNRAQARADAAAKAKADAERLQKNTELVDKEQRVNHHKLDEFAPGNGDDGLPYAEYQVYQCNPLDQFDWIGGPLYQTDNMGMAHKYAYEQYVKHRPKAFMIWQERSQGSRGNYGVKGESDHNEDDLNEDYIDEK